MLIAGLLPIFTAESSQNYFSYFLIHLYLEFTFDSKWSDLWEDYWEEGEI